MLTIYELEIRTGNTRYVFDVWYLKHVEKYVLIFVFEYKNISI